LTWGRFDLSWGRFDLESLEGLMQFMPAFGAHVRKEKVIAVLADLGRVINSVFKMTKGNSILQQYS
jgi:hypothetical protein